MRIEIDFGKCRLAGKIADQDRQEVPGLRELFFQGRYRGPGLCDQGPLGEHFHTRNSPETELPLGDAELLLLGCQDLLRCPDRRSKRRLLQGRGHDIRCQGKLGRLELISLIIDLRLKGLQLAGQPPEQVEHVRDIHRGVEKVKGADILR